MPHERHANLLQDAGLHQARIEGVAEIVKADVANASVLQRGFPRTFYDPDGTAAKIDHESFGFPLLSQKRKQPVRERDFARFAFGRFRTRHEESLLGKIHVLPSLARDFAATHAGIESDDRHGVQVTLRRAEKQRFLGETQNLAAGAPLPCHFEAGQRIRGEELLVYGPIQNSPEDAQVAIDRRIRDFRIPCAPQLSKFLGERSRDSQHGESSKERQEEPEVILVMRSEGTAHDKACRKFLKCHCRIGLDESKAAIIQLFLELVLDFLGTLSIGCSRGILMPDPVTVQVDVPLVSALE